VAELGPEHGTIRAVARFQNVEAVATGDADAVGVEPEASAVAGFVVWDVRAITKWGRAPEGVKMPQLDRIHGAVKAELIADGWAITAEQKRLRISLRVKLFGIIDLLAEQAITAERAGRKIAVEVKSFHSRRSAIVTLLTDLAETITLDQEVEAVVIAAREGDNYQLLYIGWEGEQRVFETAVYIRLRHNTIWIEHNALPVRIGELLVAAGVPREQIVLGFQLPRVRPLTDFAAA
jgi:CRISPR/Cas system-associated exonuclease Cas4 (RecB family)